MFDIYVSTDMLATSKMYVYLCTYVYLCEHTYVHVDVHADGVRE